MVLRIWWFTTLVLAALGLVLGGAHVYELPVRVAYEPRFYMQVTSTLYRYFGLVGGPLQVLALLFALGLSWRTRDRASFRWTAAGTAFLAVSLLAWFLIVQPVNVAWFEALRAGPGDAVAAYADLRSRWEGGHATAFAAWPTGFSLLVHAILREVRFPLPHSSRAE
jgi:hypothetical protein